MTDRRTFIKNSAGLAASLGMTAIPLSALYAKRHQVAPSDRVNIGLMGV
jgi:hypothetical protein